MNQTVKTFYDLNAWKKAHVLTLMVYQTTRNFPKIEQFGITSQMRRATSSVEANIAEAFGRYYFKDKQRFYFNARGSLREVQSFLVLVKDLKYISLKRYDQLFEQTEVVSKLLFGLIKSIRKQISR